MYNPVQMCFSIQSCKRWKSVLGIPLSLNRVLLGRTLPFSFFQPPTAEPKILRYGFSRETLKSAYNLPFVTTLETKLQIFQYKIIHTYFQLNVPFFAWN